MITAILALVGGFGTAQAADADDGTSAFAVLLGTDSAFDGNPATIRLTVQGEGDLIYGDYVGLAIALPVTWMTTGQDGFGISTRQSVFEIPPSLRLRFLASLPVRPYADLGLGVVFASSDGNGWLLQGHASDVGWMSRSAVGVEIGGTEGLMVLVEPLSIQTYHLSSNYTRVSGMIGVGSRF